MLKPYTSGSIGAAKNDNSGLAGLEIYLALPKGGEAATVSCRIHAHGSPQLPYRNNSWGVTLDASMTCWLISRGQKARIYTDLSPIFSAIFVSISISVCSSVCTDMSRSALIWAALLRHIFRHQLHIKRTWAVRLTMQVHMQHEAKVVLEWCSVIRITNG
jgi:hypothetical protein